MKSTQLEPSCKRRFLTLDTYAMEVNLRVNSHAKFKQSIGAFATIVQFILIAAYLGIQIETVIGRNPTISTTSVYSDIINKPQPKYYNSSTLDFAILINSISGNQTLNDELFTYIDLQIINYQSYYEEVDGHLNLVMPATVLDIELCKEGRFDNYKAFTDGVNLVNHFWCLKNSSIMLQGNYASKTSNAVFAGISDCNQKFLDSLGKNQTCKNITFEEFQHVAADLQIMVYVLTHYFDPQNFGENPIIPHVYALYTYLDPYVGINYYFKVRENRAIGTNSYLTNSLGQFNHTYYDVYIQTSDLYAPNGDFMPYVSFGFFNDEEIKTQIRSNSNLLQALSNVGGMMGVFALIMRVILTRIYQAKFPIDIHNILMKKKQLKKKIQSYKQKQKVDDSESISYDKNASKRDLNSKRKQQFKGELAQEEQQYVLSYFSMLALSCCAFLNCCLSAKTKKKNKRKEETYQKTIEEIQNSIDVLTLIKTVRKVKELSTKLKSMDIFERVKEPQKSKTKITTQDQKGKKKTNEQSLTKKNEFQFDKGGLKVGHKSKDKTLDLENIIDVESRTKNKKKKKNKPEKVVYNDPDDSIRSGSQ